MMRSLRTRLLVGTAATSIAALCILGLAIDAGVRRTLLSEFDEALAAKAKSLASMVERHDEHLDFEFNAEQMPEFSTRDQPQYFEVWNQDVILGKSPSLAGGNLDKVSAFSGATLFQTTTLPDGRTGRLVVLNTSPHVDPDHDSAARRKHPPDAILLIVARDTLGLDRICTNLRWTVFSLSAAAILLSSGVLLFIVGRGTRPVRRLADQIATLDESDLATSLESAYLPSELAPVVDRLNSLLARLAAAFTRERAFAADVAHELRTPLAGLRATLEVCRSRPRHAVDYEIALDKSLALLVQMQSLVENLLMLARAEDGQLTAKPQPVDLTLLLEECWAPFTAQAEERGLKLSLQLPATLPVATDPNLLPIVLTNLFDNAVSYTNTGGQISIHAASASDHVTIEITNSGSQLTPEDVALVFERFWRKDPSRSQTQRHAGLGLSLCRRLSAVLGGSISVESSGGNFVVRLTLVGGKPAAPEGMENKAGLLSVAG